MKTAKECRCPCVDSVDRIEEIQLDAMKEGARRAALSIDPKSSYDRNIVITERILSTAANWTKKDL